MYNWNGLPEQVMVTRATTGSDEGKIAYVQDSRSHSKGEEQETNINCVAHHLAFKATAACMVVCYPECPKLVVPTFQGFQHCTLES